MKHLLLGYVAISLITLSGCIPANVPQILAVSGTVFDSKTGQPLAGASVRCGQDPKTAVLTQATGAFFLPARNEWHLMPLGSDWIGGRCSLVVAATGYRSLELEVIPGDNLPKILRLRPSI